MLTIPDDGQKEHTVRFLTPDGETSGHRVYLKVDGKWQKAKIEPLGSYITFTTQGTEIEIAVVSAVMSRIMIAVVAIVILLLITLVVILICKKARKIKTKSSKAHAEK